MRVLKSWLKDFIDVDLPDQELADKLTFSGTLVEEIITGIDHRVIVGEIKEIKKHPNADRLQIAMVDIGDDHALEIVCGAKNIAPGQKVPLATIGTKLPEAEIRETEIRGIKSQGMLCSEKELGLSDDHEGIKILPDHYEIGRSISRYMGSDSVFDLEITPNRGDCLSHLGIARELSVLLKKPLASKNPPQIAASSTINAAIESPENCFRYDVAKITNVKIAPSPKWLRERLLALGQKPINNIVDITNFVMLDVGQPLHAFDAKKVNGDLIVRNAKDGEIIHTLDRESKKLSADMLVIADEKEPIAIAGVMGGANTEIDSSTTEIILESAEFNPKSVRKTAKLLGMRTEASYRFERAVDAEGVLPALEKAAQMIVDIAGGQVLGKKELVGDKYLNPKIRIEHNKINDLIGISLDDTKINNILTDLGFDVFGDECTAPSWRHDVLIWQDLAEEISRIYGFSNINYKEVSKTSLPKRLTYHLKEHIKDMLAELGFSETYTYSFLSESDLHSLKIESSDLLEVANPIQNENKYLRKSLKPGLLRTVAKNPSFDSIAVFEIANVFTKNSENSHLAFATSGKMAEKFIKKAVNELTRELNIGTDHFKVEELSREDTGRFKIKKPVTYIVEVNLTELFDKITLRDEKLALTIPEKVIEYRPTSKYPSVTRDLAFIVDKDVSSEKMIKTIYEQSDLINRVELFDEFTSDKFGAGKKNVAFHLDLQHQEKTLKDEEAEWVLRKTIKVLKDEHGAVLRDY